MTVKVFEGEDLELLIEKAKRELGQDLDILYYEVEKKRSIFPFFKKKYYRLFVAPKKEEEESPKVSELKEEIAELKEMLEEFMKTPSSPTPLPPVPEHVSSPEVACDSKVLTEFTGDAVELIQTLVAKGVKPEIAEEVVRESCGLDIETEKLDLNTTTFREALI